MKWSAILFDMIGTTVQEKSPDTIMGSFKKAFSKNSIQYDVNVLQANRGKDKQEMIDHILKHGGYSRELAQKIHTDFIIETKNKIGNFTLFQGVPELFESLKSKGIKIGLGSGLPKELFDEIFDHLKLHKENFDFIGISSEVGKGRPQPDMILKMIDQLQIKDKSLFLKVGDTVADIEEGKNAGVKTAVILSGAQHKNMLEAANPDFIINSISEVIDISI